MAGLKRGAGSVLWLATKPGVRGYERFPYVLQALADLGLQPPLRSNRLWAFFDSSYRSRVDLDYFADAGAKPVSPRCTWRPGTTTNPMPSVTPIFAA